MVWTSVAIGGDFRCGGAKVPVRSCLRERELNLNDSRSKGVLLYSPSHVHFVVGLKVLSPIPLASCTLPKPCTPTRLSKPLVQQRWALYFMDLVPLLSILPLLTHCTPIFLFLLFLIFYFYF